MARPRTFEPDDALNAIMQTFWQLGYEGTSMHEIERVTGLKKQSLYRLYGSKRQMYLHSLDHYAENEVVESSELLLVEGSARTRFAALFNAILKDLVKTGDRRGCFLCNSAADQAQLDTDTRAKVQQLMKAVRQAFMTALEASPHYPPGSDENASKASELLATYVGLRVLIRSNVPMKILRQSVDTAVASIVDE